MKPNCDPRFCNRLTLQFALLLVFLIAFSGCATKMALETNKTNLASLQKPVGIFTVRTANAFKPAYEPELNYVGVESVATQKEMRFVPAKPYKQVENEYLEYLVSVDLEPGDYLFKRVDGRGSSFLISGNFNFPVKARFHLSSGIAYLGHVSLTNRERKEGEEQSGAVIPLIDQAVCGFSSGTFDVLITDRSETDLPDFRRAYPQLNGVEITKAIMEK